MADTIADIERDFLSPITLCLRPWITQRTPNDRALALLTKFLTPEQAAQWTQHLDFMVVGNVSGERYLLRGGAVYLLNRSGQQIASLCFYCRSAYDTPIADVVLFQKLALESAEDEVWVKAGIMGIDIAFQNLQTAIQRMYLGRKM